MKTTAWCACAVLVVLGGCAAPKPACDEDTGEGCDAGQPPPDVCNDAAEALGDAQCELVLGAAAREAFISFSGDEDWYVVKLPGNLTPRSLLHLSGGYGVPNTAVNFSLNLLREDGVMSLATRTDKHGQAAPKPVDLILPFGESNARLLVRVGDAPATSRPNFDAKAPYLLRAEVMENPDPNEPNDTQATEIVLSPTAGQATGFLSTENDVDRFTFTAPAGRKIIYLHITAPKLSPPPPYRLTYALIDPSGKPVSEGVVANEFLDVDLATARLSTAGAYTVVIQGYRPSSSTVPVPGDLRLKYTVDVQIFDDLDVPNEPNDTLAAPRVVPITLNGTASVTGRISYVPDIDVYAFDLPASPSAPTVFTYRLTSSAAAGRFPPLSLPPDRQVRVMTEVTQGAMACRTDSALCPKGYNGAVDSALAQGLVEALCNTPGRAMCLWAERDEKVTFPNLKNFDGAVPVPPHAGTLRLYVVVQDNANNWADDKEYTLTTRLLSDADETMRAGLPAQTQTSALAPTVTSEVSGSLSFGYGRIIDHDLNRGEGLRGPDDYDAVPSDIDRFEFTFPGGEAAPWDRSWALSWELAHTSDAGTAPAALALDMEFCAGSDGGCSPVARTLAYSSGMLMPWFGSATSDRQVLWDRNVGGAATTVTARAQGCFCFEPRFVQAGKFFVKAVAADRTSNAPLNFKLRQSYGSYPQGACPATVVMGAACRFTQNP